MKELLPGSALRRGTLSRECESLGIDPAEACRAAVFRWSIQQLGEVGRPLAPRTPEELNLYGWPVDRDGVRYRVRLLALIAKQGIFGELRIAPSDWGPGLHGQPRLHPYPLLRMQAYFWACVSLLDFGIEVLPGPDLPVDDCGVLTGNVELLLYGDLFVLEKLGTSAAAWAYSCLAANHLKTGGTYDA